MNNIQYFSNNLLKQLIYNYNNTSIIPSYDDIYNYIQFNSYDPYIIIPDTYKVYNRYGNNYFINIFNINDIYNKLFVQSIMDNIFLYFLNNENNINYIHEFQDVDIVNDGYYNIVRCIDIDEKIFRDKKDENNLNAKLFSIKEACEQERNNEYKVIKYDDIYISSSKNNFNRNVIFISKKIIVDIIINQFNNIMKLPSENNFNLLLIQEFINKMKNNKKSS